MKSAPGWSGDGGAELVVLLVLVSLIIAESSILGNFPPPSSCAIPQPALRYHPQTRFESHNLTPPLHATRNDTVKGMASPGQLANYFMLVRRSVIAAPT
jgi:hypothetical protein